MSRAGSLALSMTYRTFRTRGTLATLAVFAAMACVGCTATVRSASRAAVPVVVDESLGAFEDPHNRERLEQILGSPEMQGAIQETAHALVRGALESGTDAHLQDLTAELTDTVAEALARDLRDRIIPASVNAMRESLRGALTADDQRNMLALVDGAIAQATASAIRSASVELPRSLVPAIRTAFIESLNDPGLHAAIAGMAGDATRSALVSSRDVLVELHASEGTGPVVQLVDRVQRVLERTVAATFGAGMLLGSLFIVALRYFRGDAPRSSRRVWRGPGGGAPSGPGGPPGSGGSGAGESPAERAAVHLDPSPTRAS
jgi:hypothetical protein